MTQWGSYDNRESKEGRKVKSQMSPPGVINREGG